MALLNDELSLWEIGFRWAGYDSDGIHSLLFERVGKRPPLAVRDNFRLLMDAILNGQLDCRTLSLRKYLPDTGNGFGPEFFIRHYIDDVYACVWGKKFNVRLLKWAQIERVAMLEWCERQGVPLPEFWFPHGWKLEYEWPDYDDIDEGVEDEEPPIETVGETRQRIDKRHRIKLACQQVALVLWEQAGEPRPTIKEIANRREVQELAGGFEYEIETVMAWIGEVDPRNPAQKRGRRRKNNSAPE